MKRKMIMACMIAAMVMTAAACGKGSDKPAQETQKQETQKQETQTTEEQKTESEKPVEVDPDAFVFTRENFPKMDGSTSLAPLGRAVASVLLGEEPDAVEDLIQFNKTTQSYRNLMNGECELLFASEPNAKVFDEMKEAGFAYDIEPISNEALVFVVNANNPIDSLTTQQIIDIYSGKIKNWKEVGGEDLEIAAFQRNAGAGSQALMEKLVMKDVKMAEPPKDFQITGMGELMEAVRGMDNSANAIGYSVYYYANDMRMAEGLKIIKVDGVEPSDTTIRSREYPHTNAYYCVVAGNAEEGSPARLIYDWIVSPDGQELVAAEGYVSVK